MHKRYTYVLTSFIFLLTFNITAYSQVQMGSIQGVVTDEETGEVIPFANVVAEAGGAQVIGITTDFDGKFSLKPLNPGTYNLKVSYVGYQPIQINHVIVTANKITFQDVKMGSGINIKEVVIIEYDKPLFEKDQTQTGGTVTSEEVKSMAVRDVQGIASTTAGVFQQDNGGDINVRGSRDEATVIYINGVKVSGSSALPKSAIEQLSVITGGVPAQFGDATGGIISVTTKGPSRYLSGGMEAQSSRLFNQYNDDLLGFSLTGPLLMGGDSLNKRPILGFFLSGEFQSRLDPDPSAIGVYQLKEGVLDELKENPLVLSESGGALRAAEYITDDDLELVKVKPNAGRQDYRMAGSVDFKPGNSTNFTVGGSFDYQDRDLYSFAGSLYNADNNGQRINKTGRAFARITQNFGNSNDPEAESASLIKNVYYSLQVDYEKYDAIWQDAAHQDSFFNYGYVGSFETQRAPVYSYGTDTVNGKEISAYYFTGYTDTLVNFTPSDVNSDIAAYTSQYYELMGDNTDKYSDIWTIQSGGGLLNGDVPLSVYSLWYNTGRNYSQYRHWDQTKYSLNFLGSADIGSHAVSFGFEYEQRNYKQFGTYPGGLWTLMRQLANQHISNLDVDNPVMVYDGSGVFQDTVNYDYYYDEESQSFFDYNLREALGLDADGTDWIDVDALDPSAFSLDMFSADELLNNGNSYIFYRGYDHSGKKLDYNPTLDDFFTAIDENGNYTRPVGAYSPIYMAAFIQDKFSFKDLIFNVGVRLDRFDANQMVLKDPFLLYEAKTAAEVDEFGEHPSNIGDNYVVYVNDINNPSGIVGYRSGEVWYDYNGEETTDPSALAEATSTGSITPYLQDPDAELSSSSFKDYEPQLNVMPRVAFSFPISDAAVFFAHYDVLTKRPALGLEGAIDPADYMFIQSNVGGVLANPNLKPEKTIDYEVGFKQKLSTSSALSVSAFYREMRDLINIVKINYAYPISYLTYDNVDFGTVKGLTFSYDLRRTRNVRLNANYTLQFADGTSSSSTQGYNLASAGQPNMKATFPLDFDQRHAIVCSFDYRYANGANYNGPVVFKKPIFANAGANLVFRAGSGTPYTKQKDITQGDVSDEDGVGVVMGVSQRSTKGVQNAMRLPWTYRFDLRLDKSFVITHGGKEDGSRVKKTDLNVYIQVFNLLDTRNVINVYAATGSPTDDGYLSYPAAQSAISAQTNQQAYIDQYQVKLLDYNHYTRPRMMSLGLLMNF